jgi:hypothetical protein
MSPKGQLPGPGADETVISFDAEKRPLEMAQQDSTPVFQQDDRHHTSSARPRGSFV